MPTKIVALLDAIDNLTDFILLPDKEFDADVPLKQPDARGASAIIQPKTNRARRDVSSVICGRYFTSIWMYPGSKALRALCFGLGCLTCRSRRFSTA